MRRYGIIILSFIFLIVGCGKKDKKINITFAAGKDITGTQQKLIELFTQKYSSYTVKLIEMPESATSQRDSYVTYLSAKDPSIDVYAVDITWPAEFAHAQWILPLDEYFTIKEQKEFLQGPIKACKYQDKIYAVPWFTDAGLLYYRKDLLTRERLSPPKTWEELVKQASNLQRKYRINGFTFQGEQYEGIICNFLEYLWAFGGQIIDESGKVTIDTPQAKQALQFIYDLIYTEKIVSKSVLTYKEEESRQLFTSGHSIFLRNWPYVWPLANDENSSRISGLVGVAPIPGSANKTGISTLGGWNLAISNFSKHPEHAWKFIEFMTSPGVQKIYAIQGGRLPARKSIYKDKEVLNHAPYYKTLYSAFVNSKPRPINPKYSQISDILQIEIHKVLTNRQSIEEALKNAQEKVSAIIVQTQ